MDYPAAGQLACRCLNCLAEPYRRPRVALVLDRLASGPDDCSGNAAAVLELGVGRIRDRVDFERRDVDGDNFDLSHSRAQDMPAQRVTLVAACWAPKTHR